MQPTTGAAVGAAIIGLFYAWAVRPLDSLTALPLALIAFLLLGGGALLVFRNHAEFEYVAANTLRTVAWALLLRPFALHGPAAVGGNGPALIDLTLGTGVGVCLFLIFRRIGKVFQRAGENEETHETLAALLRPRGDY